MDFLLHELQSPDVRTLLKSALLPPSLNIWLGLLGLILMRWYPKTGKSLMFFTLAFFYVLSTTLGEFILAPSKEIAKPLDIAKVIQIIDESKRSDEAPQAIVVLAGGRDGYSPEYGKRGTISEHTLVRIRYAAHLQRDIQLPILVSGWGEPFEQKPGETQMMVDALTKEFSVPVKWIEGNSRTTAENALYSSKMLLPLSINNIILVTEVAHMARAKEAFVRNGFTVTTAPTGYGSGIYRGRARRLSLIKRVTPKAAIFQRNSFYLQERLGVLWYRLAELRKN